MDEIEPSLVSRRHSLLEFESEALPAGSRKPTAKATRTRGTIHRPTNLGTISGGSALIIEHLRGRDIPRLVGSNAQVRSALEDIGVNLAYSAKAIAV